MHACVLHAAGDLRVKERTPSAPGPGEVAVTVALGGIRGSILHHYRHGRVGDFTVRAPMVRVHEIVGHVAALGRARTSRPPATLSRSIRPPCATGHPAQPVRRGTAQCVRRHPPPGLRRPHTPRSGRLRPARRRAGLPGSSAAAATRPAQRGVGRAAVRRAARGSGDNGVVGERGLRGPSIQSTTWAADLPAPAEPVGDRHTEPGVGEPARRVPARRLSTSSRRPRSLPGCGGTCRTGRRCGSRRGRSPLSPGPPRGLGAPWPQRS